MAKAKPMGKKKGVAVVIGIGPKPPLFSQGQKDQQTMGLGPGSPLAGLPAPKPRARPALAEGSPAEEALDRLEMRKGGKAASGKAKGGR